MSWIWKISFRIFHINSLCKSLKWNDRAPQHDDCISVLLTEALEANASNSEFLLEPRNSSLLQEFLICLGILDAKTSNHCKRCRSKCFKMIIVQPWPSHWIVLYLVVKRISLPEAWNYLMFKSAPKKRESKDSRKYLFHFHIYLLVHVLFMFM